MMMGVPGVGVEEMGSEDDKLSSFTLHLYVWNLISPFFIIIGRAMTGAAEAGSVVGSATATAASATPKTPICAVYSHLITLLLLISTTTILMQPILQDALHLHRHLAQLSNNPFQRSIPRSSSWLSLFLFKLLAVPAFWDSTRQSLFVVAVIKEIMKCGQPYLGTFLLKDKDTDSDVITDINSVHQVQVGVYAQIISVFAAFRRNEDDKEEGLTAVLYPHRQIKIAELVKAGPAKTPQVHPQTVELPTPPSPAHQQLSFFYLQCIPHTMFSGATPSEYDDIFSEYL